MSTPATESIYFLKTNKKNRALWQQWRPDLVTNYLVKSGGIGIVVMFCIAAFRKVDNLRSRRHDYILPVEDNRILFNRVLFKAIV